MKSNFDDTNNRIIYKKPSFKVYGSLTNLTTGGSSMMPEMIMKNGKLGMNPMMVKP